MRRYLLISRTRRGKYNVAEFNTRRAAEQAAAEVNLLPETLTWIIVDSSCYFCSRSVD